MSETPALPSSASNGVRPAQSAELGKGAGAVKPNGPAFEVLLERLTNHAAELEEKSKALASPDQLPAAVDTARASLEDALTLGEKLLEAYRAAHGANRPPEVKP